MEPACYQKATKTCCCKEGFSKVVEKATCIQKIFAQNVAKISTWQLDFLQEWSKVALKIFFLYCFTKSHILQYQPKLINANLQSLSIFQVLVL